MLADASIEGIGVSIEDSAIYSIWVRGNEPLALNTRRIF